MIKIGLSLILMAAFSLTTSVALKTNDCEKNEPEESVEDGSTVGNPNEGFILFSINRSK